MIRYQSLLRDSRAFRLFLGDAERDSLNHCYLLESPDETALVELVKLMASALACESAEKPCLACAGCKRYEHLAGGNILVYPKEDRIKKDDVLDLIRNVNYRAFEHGRKIAVLKRADRMDANIQNKLLKTLEEPPENVVFFLLASNANKLLPTIRSRARLLELERFSEDRIYAELSERLESGQRLRDACTVADGCVGTAERCYSDPEFERLFAFSLELISGVNAPADFAKFSSRFDEIKPRYEDVLDLLSLELRDALMLSEGLADRVLLKGRPEIAKIASARPERISDLIGYVHLCKKKIVSNCNSAAAFSMLLVELLHVKEEI